MKYLISGALALGLAACAPSTDETDTDPTQSGTSNVTLSVFQAIAIDGQRAPQYDGDCAQRFADLNGTQIRTSWSVNTSTLREAAASTVYGEVVNLNAEGLEDVYQFVSGDLPRNLQDRDLRLVIFSLNEDLEEPFSQLLFSFENEPYQCEVSSIARINEQP